MAKVRIDKKRLEGMLYEEGMAKITAEVALDIVQAAKAIYLSLRQLPDHNDYLGSFEIKRRGKNYIVTNTDDTAFWVEFGAHAGGKTPVLGYAPLRRGIDAVASTH